MIFKILLVTTFILHYSEITVENDKTVRDYPQITASIETEPVHSPAGKDAADDPAIWVNSESPSQSLIVGCDKKLGISVYGMDGKEVSFFPAGEINNIDLRDGFNLNGESIVLVAGSNRTKNSVLNNTICLFKLVKNTGKLVKLNEIGIETNLDNVYGFCMAKDPENQKFYAFVNNKSGIIQQWELFATQSGTVDGKLVRSLKVNTQPEGMVVDEELGFLYVGEEDKGIWKFSAKADGDTKGFFISRSAETNPEIKYDIEGLGIYCEPNGKGYLVASSQGNDSYAVFSREGNNRYLFSFKIEDGIIDGVSDTDGIDISSSYINESFPAGILVVQDGHNTDKGNQMAQNFKYIDWRQVIGFYNNK